MEDFSLRIGGWGGRGEGRKGRGRLRAAVGDQLTTAGGIFSRSPTWGNGGLEVLQPAAPLGRGASSPIDGGSRSAVRPYILPFFFLPDPGVDGGGNSIKCSLFFLLINVVPTYVRIRIISAGGMVCVFFKAAFRELNSGEFFGEA